MSDSMNWAEVSQRNDLSEEFIRKHAKSLHWHAMINNENAQRVMQSNPELVNWSEIATDYWNKASKAEPHQYSDQFLTENAKHLNQHFDAIRKNTSNEEWTYISALTGIDEKFLRDNADYLNWEMVSESQYLSESALEDFIDKIDLDAVTQHQILPESFIDKHSDDLDWRYVSQYQPLTVDFIEKHEEEIFWLYASRNSSADQEVFNKYEPKIQWDQFSIYASDRANIQILLDHADDIDWTSVTLMRELTPEFIQLTKEYLDWEQLSVTGTLDEATMEQCADKLNWANASIYQTMSEDFIRQHADQVDWNAISEHQKLSQEFIQEYADRVNWTYILECQESVTPEMIIENANLIDWDHASEYASQDPFVYDHISEKTGAGIFQEKFEEWKERAKEHENDALDAAYLSHY